MQPLVLRDLASNEVVDRLIFAKQSWSSELDFIDATGGLGAGVVDQLRARGLSPVAVEYAGAPADKRFANKRAEMWWNMAEWIKKSKGALPNIPELVQELSEPTYTFDKSGRLLIEPKEMIKKRLGSSPDLADALANTFAYPEMQAAGPLDHLRPRANQASQDWDPYADR
jgi:hypothetical protein